MDVSLMEQKVCDVPVPGSFKNPTFSLRPTDALRRVHYNNCLAFVAI